MPDQFTVIPLIIKLNALAGGFFLLTALALTATRQILACLRIYIFQSVLLAISALFLGWEFLSIHLAMVAAITLSIKAIVIPLLLRRTIGADIYARREISQILNIPTSLLIAAAITIFAYIISSSLINAAGGALGKINLPIGLAGLFLGAYTITVRREAVPQVIGLLAMENGAFFAGISIAPDLPLIAELAAAFDVLIVALVMGILTKKIHEKIGTTAVGELAALKEDSFPWK